MFGLSYLSAQLVLVSDYAWGVLISFAYTGSQKAVILPIIVPGQSPVRSFGRPCAWKGLYMLSCVRRYLFGEISTSDVRGGTAGDVLPLDGARRSWCSPSNSGRGF